MNIALRIGKVCVGITLAKAQYSAGTGISTAPARTAARTPATTTRIAALAVIETGR